MSARGWGAKLTTAVAVLAALYLAVGGIAAQLAGRSVLADTDYMVRYGPYANSGFVESQSKNLMQSDVYSSELPAEYLFAQGVKSGRLSAWDPYIVGGTPLGGITNNALASPVTAPFYVLPSWLAPAYERLAEVVVGLVGLYLFLRRLKLSPPAALLGGMAYVSGAYMVAWQGWPQTRVGAFVPLVFWAVERFLQRRRIRDVAILALAVAGLLLGGFPSVAGYALLTAAGYALVRTRRLGLLAGLTTGVAAGIGLAMFQLLPFARFYSSWLIQGRGQTGADHLNPVTFLTSFAPWAFGGVASDGPQLWFLDQNAVESLSFVGAAVLVLALVAVLALRRGRALLPRGVWVFFVAGTAVWLLLVYRGGWLLGGLQQVPVLRAVFAANFIGRARAVTGLLLACLAAVGFEVLLRRSESPAKGAVPINPASASALGSASGLRAVWWRARPAVTRWAPPVWVAVVLLTVGATLWRLLAVGHRLAAANGTVNSSAGQPASATYDAEVHKGLLLLGAAALLAGVLWAVSRYGASIKRLDVVRTLAACGVLVLVAGEGTGFIGRYSPSADRETFYPITDTQAFLAANLGNSRYASTSEAAVLGTDSVYGLRALNGHAFLNSAFAALVQGVPGNPIPAPTRLQFSADVAQATSPILDRLGVAYFTAAPNEAVFGTHVNAVTDGSSLLLQPNVPTQVTLPIGDNVRALGLMPAGSADDVFAYAPKSANDWIEVSVSDGSGTVTSTQRLTTGIKTGTEFDVPIALDSAAAHGPRTATITLHTAKTKPLAVQANAGSVALATVVDPGDDDLRLVHAGSSVIYERLNALPRIRWASSAVVVPNAAERVRLLASGSLDTSTVVLNSGTPLSGAGAGTGSVTTLTDGTDSVGVTLNATDPGYLVVADSDQVGWSATVDGKKAKLVPADQGLVAVQVPAGTHTVTLRYSSPDGGLGGYASAATAFGLAGGVGVETWYARRGRAVTWEFGWLRGRPKGTVAVGPGPGPHPESEDSEEMGVGGELGEADVGAADVGAASGSAADADETGGGPDVLADAGV
ncbi:MAG: YfhO family protein [Catenulispora sp.]|nr:YfhO family protein [Catenulispora sp.]